MLLILPSQFIPGTIAMNPAAKSPAPGDHISLVRKYVAIAVSPLKCKATGSIECHDHERRKPNRNTRT